ncbi:MAG: RDD family protein [Phycisphaerales bacterium JB040]
MSVGALIRCVLALLVSSAGARAQEHTGVGSSERAGQGAHAWVTVQESDETWRLVHFPPRGFGEHAARAGQIRPVLPLETPPDAMCAIGDRVYLVYTGDPSQPSRAPEPGDGETDGGARSLVGSGAGSGVVRVFSMRAVPVWGGYWSYEPPGEFRSHPSIETGGRVIGAAPDGEGRLLVGLADDAGTPRLMRLDSDGWSEADWAGVPTPGDPGAGERVGADLRLVSDGAGPVLVSIGEGESRTTHRFGGRRVRTERDGETLRVLEGGADDAWVIAEIDGVVGRVDVAPVRSGGGRLVVLARAEGVSGSEAFELIEVSLATGEVLYRGAPEQVSPISATEFRVFAVLLLGFTLVVLLLTFRPGLDPSEVIVPSGLALADPGRRLLASVLDLLLVAGLVGAIYDTPVSSIVTGTVVFQAGGAWMALPMTLIAGWLVSALFECTLAGTPGKLLTGCRVACLGEVPRRLSPGRALLRNGVKWLVPPIAALALLDPQSRHRGDDLARAAVVVRMRPGSDDAGGGAQG